MQYIARLNRLVAISIVTMLLLVPSLVGAQSTGLRINPRSDMVVKAGDTQSATLLVSNLNKNVPITVDLSVIDFKSSDESGTPTPILEENAEPTPWSLKPFISIPQTVELDKGESKYVPYTVTIPEGQGAGSYYSAIKYDPRPTDETSTVVISGAPMQLIFVTVPGKATELMVLKEYGAYINVEGQQQGKFKSVYVNSQPQQFAYLLENRGNVAESPSGSIAIKNIFGKTIRIIESANPKGNLALIGQTRRFQVCIEASKVKIEQDGRTTTVEDCLDPGLAPGMYRAEMRLYYGINGSNTQEISATTTFWYLPLWFIAIIIGILALIAYVIYRIREKLVGRKKHKRQR